MYLEGFVSIQKPGIYFTTILHTLLPLPLSTLLPSVVLLAGSHSPPSSHMHSVGLSPFSACSLQISSSPLLSPFFLHVCTLMCVDLNIDSS